MRGAFILLPLLASLAVVGCGGQSVESSGSPGSPTPFPTFTPTPTPSATPSPVGSATPLPPQAIECSGATLKGIDVSDGNGTIDWASAKAAGISFAYIKATQGSTFEASTFPSNWSGAGAAGVIRGAYHFFDPTVDGVTQANWFLSRIGTLGAGDLPPALDIECPDGDPQCLGYPGGTGSAPATVIAQRASDWLNTVTNATGKMPVIYTYLSYFPDNGVNASGFGAAGLWIANYGVSCPSDPSPWTSSRFWQYSSTGSVTGVAGNVDVDVYFGTLSDLTQYAVWGG